MISFRTFAREHKEFTIQFIYSIAFSFVILAIAVGIAGRAKTSQGGALQNRPMC